MSLVTAAQWQRQTPVSYHYLQFHHLERRLTGTLAWPTWPA